MKDSNMKYVAVVEQEGNDFIVSFPDIPEATTVVQDLNDLQFEGLYALESAFELYSGAKCPIPLPREVGKDACFVVLPTTLAAKVFLYNEWLLSDQNKVALADKIGVKPSNLNRLFDFKYRSKMDAIEKALSGLGKHIEIRVV